MNKKGIILSVYVYVLLVFFLLIIGSLLVILNNTRILSDIIKSGAKEEADNMKYGFSVNLSGEKTVCQNFGQTYVEPGFNAKDKDGNSLEVTVTSNLDIWKVGEYTVKYTARFNNKEKTAIRNVIVLKNDYSYTGTSQTFTVPCDGIYNIELWGAQGGGSSGGKGGYVRGNIQLSKNNNLYIYVGQSKTGSDTTSFNGGTSSYGGSPGGGGTDIRLISGAWNSSRSLISRIMVAGGGGAATSGGGPGGGLSGSNGGFSTGGTQISGGLKEILSGYDFIDGTFGIGGGGCGGGGGYYGGGGSACANGGAGGSSFISGFQGCNAIDINGNISNQPIHYSGLQFDNMIMLSGAESMPSPTGALETGHSGNGYAKITYLGPKDSVNNSSFTVNKFVAIGNNTGVKLRIQKNDATESVMVRRKTTPWTNTDTTATGTLISNTITITNEDNVWYSDSTAVNGTTYYYKAFPYVDGAYKYLPYENETSAVGGGLVTEYTFEGNLNDSSGASANSNGSAAITYESGKIGITSKYNGTSSYVFSPTILDSGTYSISSWIYLNGIPAAGGFVIATAESGGNYLYQAGGQNTYTIGVHFNGTYQYYALPITVSNRWVHIVYVVDTVNNKVKIYYNGSLVSFKTYTGPYGTTLLSGADRGTCIGCNPGNGGVRSELFDGKVDQVRMYNRELLPSEVLSLYNE